MVMIDGSLYDGDQDDWLELVTVHEVAHQWWYGLVGNDEVHDSWLDEGLTEYSTILYYGQRYGREEEEYKYQTYINKGKFNCSGSIGIAGIQTRPYTGPCMNLRTGWNMIPWSTGRGQSCSMN